MFGGILGLQVIFLLKTQKQVYGIGSLSFNSPNYGFASIVWLAGYTFAKTPKINILMLVSENGSSGVFGTAYFT